MFMEIIIYAILAFIASLWIDKLYMKSTELSFPDKILARSRYRKYFLFFSFVILFSLKPLEPFKLIAIYFLILMTVTDFEQYMLFDVMTLPFALIGGVFAWQNEILTENFISAIIGGGIFFLLAIISRGAIGGGDIKLIFGIGMWLGAENLLNVVLIGAILGGVAALLMILAKKKKRDSYFAYGPYFTLPTIYFLFC